MRVKRARFDAWILAIRFDVCVQTGPKEVPAGALVVSAEPYRTGIQAYIARDRSKGWAGDIFARDDCLYSDVQISEKSGRRILVASHCD